MQQDPWSFGVREVFTYAFLIDRYRKELLYQARLAAAFEAYSYRQFYVGCALLARNRRGQLKIFTGGNIKRGENCSKECAEYCALRKALEEGYYEILIIAVAGFPQPDKHSGKESMTLHPCGDCRSLMRDVYRIPHDTPIVTASLYEDSPAEEHQSFLALCEFHRS
jgi:cytidine deaminase